MTKRILHVVTNVSHYADPHEPTGLWLSELTHAYDIFEAKGYEQRIVSPQGGPSPLEPRALKWPLIDASAKAWLNDPARMALLSQTARPDEIDPAQFDAIYFTGGHAVMWDFPDDTGLQELARAIWERGGIVSSVCHGYCGLLNIKLRNGTALVAGKRVTGFAWSEEVVADVARKVPYNAEKEMKRRDARYQKGDSAVYALFCGRWTLDYWTKSLLGQSHCEENRRYVAGSIDKGSIGDENETDFRCYTCARCYDHGCLSNRQEPARRRCRSGAMPGGRG
ncbi:type 1 glutamine amidotransferase domain-containing protein [Sphingobium baderi]|uniref:type 1 glutamine amidotransferase domain-containing protein n=1 Tax=Sphingobium baderi TaxID=1332080 RepID=UPI0003FB6C5D|nr:type 1 glutamine amidotransferase domain-containing protein [Sphingobium baderi]KMS63211.1 dimethyl sulfoxide reductase subunit C [Sphingobium baderi LL03]WRD77048.1 type 1 glutamine amidotransferase domain-containing protein [Sphingobium baderi]